MQNPSKDYYRRIDSSSRSLTSYSSHTYRAAMSCEKDNGCHRDDVPHSTSSTSFDVTLQTTDDLALEGNTANFPTTALRDMLHSKSPPSLPPKPLYENVSRRMASADQHDSYKQNNTLPSQPYASAAYGLTPIDQCRFESI